MLKFDGRHPVGLKIQILTFVSENCEKPAIKHPTGKPISLNFMNLFKMFCPRLQKKVSDK